ncbi:MAG TPA: hypothetical protein VGQ57_07885, partial [Polyangiaceae bacterium]|nr:hypothetical protein [Polyangiaceae bacterium]
MAQAVRASRFALGALFRLTLGCGPGAPELASNGDAQVIQADAPRFCDAFAVIERKCQRCHGDPPANGAPFPLTS